MPHIKLTYFDFPGGRGEECRLALHVAGVDFEDNRIKGDAWRELEPSTPFGALPILEVEGLGTLAQSNVIAAWVGRQHGLHPTDPWQAAQHEALMGAVEDFRSATMKVLSIKGDERESARQAFAEGPLQQWGARFERQIAGQISGHNGGPFVAGEQIHVADIKLFVIQKWFVGGGVDLIPTDVFRRFEKLSGVYDAVAKHPRVVDWYAR